LWESGKCAAVYLSIPFSGKIENASVYITDEVKTDPSILLTTGDVMMKISPRLQRAPMTGV